MERPVRPIDQRFGEDEQKHDLSGDPAPAVLAHVVVHLRVVVRDQHVDREHEGGVAHDADDDPLDRGFHLFRVELVGRMKAGAKLLEIEVVRHGCEQEEVEHPEDGKHEKHHAGGVRQA